MVDMCIILINNIPISEVKKDGVEEIRNLSKLWPLVENKVKRYQNGTIKKNRALTRFKTEKQFII
jgi:hypothetical protein